MDVREIAKKVEMADKLKREISDLEMILKSPVRKIVISGGMGTSNKEYDRHDPVTTDVIESILHTKQNDLATRVADLERADKILKGEAIV